MMCVTVLAVVFISMIVCFVNIIITITVFIIAIKKPWVRAARVDGLLQDDDDYDVLSPKQSSAHSGVQAGLLFAPKRKTMSQTCVCRSVGELGISRQPAVFWPVHFARSSGNPLKRACFQRRRSAVTGHVHLCQPPLTKPKPSQDLCALCVDSTTSRQVLAEKHMRENAEDTGVGS